MLRCTLARCRAAAAVLALCLLLSRLSPGLSARVGEVYHTLLEAPLGSTARVWSAAARQVGVDLLVQQMEQSVLALAQMEPQDESEQTAPSGGQLAWNGQTLPEGVSGQRAVFSVPAVSPAAGRLSCSFGPRVHPITGKDDFHTGIDIAAAAGSGVYAAWPGVVCEVGSSAVYGNYVVVDHGGGLSTAYCHCQTVLAEPEAHLRAGERIATVGSTGISTGPHLHFEVRLGGLRADPLAAFDL